VGRGSIVSASRAGEAKKCTRSIPVVRDARRATMGKVDKSDDGAWKETHEK